MSIVTFFKSLFFKKVMYHSAESLEELNEYYFPLYDKITEIMGVSTAEEIDKKMKYLDEMYYNDIKVLKYNLKHKKTNKKNERITARMQAVREYLAEKKLKEQENQTQAIECKTEVMRKTEMLEEGEENEE